MKKWSVAVFLIGILIGLGLGYVISPSVKSGQIGSKSWHQLTSFILSSGAPNLANTVIAYSYPNVYNDTSPHFTVDKDIWRVKLETVPYYKYAGHIVYYAPTPITLKAIWTPTAVGEFPRVVGPITVLEPGVLDVTTWVTQNSICYALSGADYAPVRAVYNFTGAGIYVIKFVEKTFLANITGCFNFAIEEYY
jgi:hypothetical protein